MISKLNELKEDKGLSLIELSIVLTVIGLLVSGFLQLYNIQAQKKLNSLQNYKILTIRDGLAKFLGENGHLPCPAARDIALTEAGAGGGTKDEGVLSCNDETVAVDNCDDGNAHPYCVVENRGFRIRIGSIPFKALNLGREDVTDVYGNQFTYAVAEIQTDPAEYVFYDRDIASLPDYRAIDLLNFTFRENSLVPAFTPPADNCDPITKVCELGEEYTQPVDLLFYSHGKDGMGSYTVSGVLNGNACTDDDDATSENCDNDATFISDVYAVRSDDIDGEYDDRLRFSLADWTYIWTDSAKDSSSIFNNTAGNMGVGTKEPEEKLHVQGGNVRIEEANVGGVDVGGKIQASKLCDNESDAGFDGCFEPELIGGDVGSDRLVCGDDEVMRQIRGGEKICVSVLGNSGDDCDGTFNFVKGITLNISSGVLSASCDTTN